MLHIRKRIELAKIHKLIKPLTFVYDRLEHKSDTDYLIGWLNGIGINASDITDDNVYSSIITLNVGKAKGNYELYCITLLMCSGLKILDEQLAEIKSEADKYKAIPVIFVDKSLDNQMGLMAKTLGIQIVTASQLEGLNRLIYDNEIPAMNNSSTLLVHKIAEYARIKLTELH